MVRTDRTCLFYHLDFRPCDDGNARHGDGDGLLRTLWFAARAVKFVRTAKFQVLVDISQLAADPATEPAEEAGGQTKRVGGKEQQALP